MEKENPSSILCLTMLLRCLRDSSTDPLRLMTVTAALRFTTVHVALRMLTMPPRFNTVLKKLEKKKLNDYLRVFNFSRKVHDRKPVKAVDCFSLGTHLLFNTCQNFMISGSKSNICYDTNLNI